MATLAQIRTAFRFDAKAQRWRNRSGAFVAEQTITDGLRRFAKSAGRSLQRLTARMYAGEISLAEWQEQAADRVKSIHLAMRAAAAGGFGRMTQADYGQVGQILRGQYARLGRFAETIAAGRKSEAQSLAQIQMYAASGNGTYQNGRRAKAFGVFAFERRILGIAEHCRDCLAASARGWVPIGTLPAIADSLCRHNCKCRFAFR